MKDSKAVKLIALAYDEGRSLGFSEGFDCAREEYKETLAAKSQAYEEGYKRGVEDQGKKTLELMAEARASERQVLETFELCLSVWFVPYVKNLFFDNEGNLLPQSPDPAKLNGIQAIRQAYGQAEGYGLKEVKALVETESFGARVSCGQPLPQSKAVALYLQLQAAGFDPVLKS